VRRAAARLVIAGLAVSLSVAALAGCGRKAPNLPPENSTYPRVYPAPTSPGAGPPASTLAPPSNIDEGRRVTAPPS